jgi:3-oxoadipate enol-lactonase
LDRHDPPQYAYYLEIEVAVELYVESIGHGPPVLLIPGLGYASWCWREQAPLADGWRLWKIDPRGAGRSPKPDGPYTIAGMAEDIAATIGQHGPFHVVGHSLGGYLAMLLALEYPDLVRSLLLIATTSGGPGHTPLPDATREAWLREAGKSPLEYARATMHLSFSPGWAERHPGEYEHWLQERLEYPTPPAAWAAQYEAGSAYLARGIEVEKLEVPTLIVHGREDRILPVGNGIELASRIATSRLIQIDGLGHLVQMERPDIFNPTATAFWWGLQADS